MTLQELKFITILARERHFGKASSACFVSQPTLSIAVRKLEEELGAPIFERNKNEVQITQFGAKILIRARRVLEEAEAIRQVARHDKDELTGCFKLGVIYTIGPYILPPLIKALSQLAPKMPLEIQEDFTENLRLKLRNGELDAIIVSLPFTEPTVTTKILYKENFAVLMPEKHPLAQLKTVSETELCEYNLLLLEERHCFREQVVSSCPACFVPNKKNKQLWQTVSGSSLETVRHMVASGMGVTILPMTAATTDLCPYRDNYLTQRPLRGKKPTRSVALAWRKTFPRPKAIAVLQEAVSQCEFIGVCAKS